MKKTRFCDWNSLLGTVLFAAIVAAVTILSFIYPDEDSRLVAKLIPYVGPVIAFVALYRLVIYIEVGPNIAFRRIFGRREYTWDQVRDVETREVPKRYFGVIRFTHLFLLFKLERGGQIDHHAYRISKRQRTALSAILKENQVREQGVDPNA